MSELYREQHPLLCDDFSEDEFNCQNYSPRTNTHTRQVVYTGRAKTRMKGAASILTRWPEHWSTLRYWWMGLGMIAIVVLIVYNSVVAFSMLPLTYTKILKPRTFYNSFGNSVLQQSINIYMHVFAGTDEETNLNDVLPYVEIVSKRHQNFKFHLIVVKNDTFERTNAINDQTRNNVARDSLWSDETFDNNNYKIMQNNLDVSYVSLKKYMEDPALRKITKDLSKEFIEFLIRALSIWEKGGIAFNPIVLTPRSPNAIYLEKIQNLLNKYKQPDSKQNLLVNKNLKANVVHTPKKKFNNIRDIIDALEVGNRYYNGTQYNLTEAEDKIYSVSLNMNNKGQVSKNENFSVPLHKHLAGINIKDINIKQTKQLQSKDHSEKSISEIHQFEPETKIDLSNDTTKPSLLPLFLEFLFPKRDKLVIDDINKINNMKDGNKIKSLKNADRGVLDHTYHDKDHHGSMTIDVKNKRDLNSYYQAEKYDSDSNALLSIDLRGNIIASNIKCHAFVGNLLSNAVHHIDGETLTEFIIAELTVFCKGVLFSCKGIDIILL
ncbi:uncharacterized protein [Battus philenor]|uniref:uncharacterized protein n=1 Tax=Battus philenor TaxID=42288 RepID=UPI0035D0A674